MINHSALCRSIKYDYINILTWTILKKRQILNGCKTFAFKYMFWMRNKENRFPIHTLIWRPVSNGVFKVQKNSADLDHSAYKKSD